MLTQGLNRGVRVGRPSTGSGRAAFGFRTSEFQSSAHGEPERVPISAHAEHKWVPIVTSPSGSKFRSW